MPPYIPQPLVEGQLAVAVEAVGARLVAVAAAAAALAVALCRHRLLVAVQVTFVAAKAVPWVAVLPSVAAELQTFQPSAGTQVHHPVAIPVVRQQVRTGRPHLHSNQRQYTFGE